MRDFDVFPDASGGFDFLVDGVFLGDVIAGACESRPPYISLLRRSLSGEGLTEQFARLLGRQPGPYYPTRIWLYFCPECFDEGCGGISANITFTGSRVLWSNFSFDFEAEPGESEQELLDEVDQLSAIPDLVFDRQQYEDVLNRLQVELSKPLLPMPGLFDGGGLRPRFRRWRRDRSLS